MIDRKDLENKIPQLEERWRSLGCRIYQKVWPGSVKSERLWGSVKAIEKLSKNYDCSTLNLLDIGCNCGVLSTFASQYFNSVTGIDKDDISSEKGGPETAAFFDRDNCKFVGKNVGKYCKDGHFEEDGINAIMAYQVLYLLFIFANKQYWPIDTFFKHI